MKKIRYECATIDGWKPVEGYELGTMGLFAAQRWSDYAPIAAPGFSVTHLPSGFYVPIWGSSPKSLAWAIDELEETIEEADDTLFDFTDYRKLPRARKALIAEIIGGLGRYE